MNENNIKISTDELKRFLEAWGIPKEKHDEYIKNHIVRPLPLIELYEIIQIDFENDENTTSLAKQNISLGIVEDKEEVDKIINDLFDEFGARYKGRDGIMYPYYIKKKLKRFDKSKLNK